VVTIDDVIAAPPLVHYDELNGELRTFGLGEEQLRWIIDNVRPEQRTLETGSGLSTIAFALAGSAHTVVVPHDGEEQRIRAYCDSQGIATGNVSFVLQASERALPALDLGLLDVVLIDGSHSFPHVFIDWYYAAGAVLDGGVMIIDDTQLWTGALQRDFLVAEPGWTLERDFSGRTALFRRGQGADPDRLWVHQPYVADRSRSLSTRQVVTHMVRSGQWAGLVTKARQRAARRFSDHGGHRLLRSWRCSPRQPF